MVFWLVGLGCEPVEISRTKPWWETTSFDVDGGMRGGRATGGSNGAAGDPGADVEGRKQGVPAVIENADGTLTLNTPIPAYLVSHLHNALIEERYDLILDQLVAESTKAMYEDEGRNSWEIVEWMEANRRDVIKILMRMSGGFNSPNMTWTQRGQVYRMQLTGRTAQGMRFTIMDIRREGGDFRLVLIK